MAEALNEAAAGPTKKRKIKWRKLLRALHRDAGYLCVGFTFIYAISGIAVNHIADLGDTSFSQIEKTVPLAFEVPDDDKAAAKIAAAALDIDSELTDAYRATDTQLILTFERMTVDIDTATQQVNINGQEPRFFLRIANWLHVHRQTTAWTYIADTYAVLLLYLAISGMFMIAGRKGILGRGGLLVMAGVAIPIVFVVASGGPHRRINFGMRPNTLSIVFVLGAIAFAPVSHAVIKCKGPIQAARGELLVCKQGGSTECTFPKYQELLTKRKRCLSTKEGKSLQAYYAQVQKALEARKLEVKLRSKLKSATDTIMLAKPGELPETMEIASFARAAYHSHKAKYGAVSKETEAAVARLDAALRTRQPDLDALKDKLGVARKAIVKTGQYTSDDGLRPEKVAEVWTRASRGRLVRVKSLMNSSLQQFVWAPSTAANSQVQLIGDRTAAPSFELRQVGSMGVQMRVLIARGALVSIGTPLIVWEADTAKDYFIGIAPDGARFRVPYVIKDGAKTYETVEPLPAGKPRFKPMRHPKLPGAALADLARVGVLDAALVKKLEDKRAAAVACYDGTKKKLEAKLAKLRDSGKTAAADKLMGSIPDVAGKKCGKLVKPVKKIYGKLMKRYAAKRAKAFATIRGLFDVPAK